MQSNLYRLITFLLLFLLSEVTRGQIQPIYSVPTPEVAGLGTYGTIPVSHFTGVPDISIPLYDIKEGEISVPINVRYHIASVKPTTTIGVLGLGWSLEAGGYIARTVRGQYDEKKGKSDGNHSGFYDHVKDMQSIDGAKFKSLLDSQIVNQKYYDLSADEFNFNFCGHTGRFYLNSNKSWTVVSDENIKVEFEANNGGFIALSDIQDRINYPSSWYCKSENNRFFNRFTLVTPDGYRYEFGGIDAIDFSISYYSRTESDLIPTAWWLSKITTPHGHSIKFKYSATTRTCDLKYVPQYKLLMNTPTQIPETYQRGEAGYTGFLLFPARLDKIETANDTIQLDYYQDNIMASSQRGTHALCWQGYSKREDFYSQNKYNSASQFYTFLPKGIRDIPNLEDYVVSGLRTYTLHRICIKRRKREVSRSIYFDYNRTNIRKLSKITMRAGIPDTIVKNVIDGDGYLRFNGYVIPNKKQRDNFPEYNFFYSSKTMPHETVLAETDSWGYYTGDKYSLSELPSFEITSPNFSSTQAEILTGIQYPTGGRTLFEYELNDYSKQLEGRVDNIRSFSYNRKSGGLRLSALKNYDMDWHLLSSKKYYYKKEKDSKCLSSGVSKGLPVLSLSYHIANGIQMNIASKGGYFASITNENSPVVGYSYVIEEQLDSLGNSVGYTRFTYSNYDMDIYGGTHLDVPAFYTYNISGTDMSFPYTSNSLERGKLLSTEYFDKDGHLVRDEKLMYKQIMGNQFVTAHQQGLYLSPYIGEAYIGWLTRTYTYSYLPIQKTVTEHLQNSSKFSQNIEYHYNEYKQLNRECFQSSDGTPLTVSYIHPTEIASHSWMVKKNIISPIIVTKTEKDNQIKEIRKEYAKYKDFPYLQRMRTKGNSSIRIDFNVTYIDQYANPVEIDEHGKKSVLIWAAKGQKLIARVENMSYPELKFFYGCDALSYSDQKAEDIDYTQLEEARKKCLSSYFHIYKYNNDLQLISFTEPNGQTSLFEYDVMDRLKGTFFYETKNGKTTKNIINAFDYHYCTDMPGTNPKEPIPYNVITIDDIVVPIEDSNDKLFVDTLYKYYATFGANYVVKMQYINALPFKGYKTIDYFDGLGRNTETVQVDNNPQKCDIITLHEYDCYGRKQATWLPGISPSSNGEYALPQNIKNNVILTYGQDKAPFTSKHYENNPVGKIIEELGPGEEWQNNGKSIKTSYLTNKMNNDTLKCILFNVSNPNVETMDIIAKSYYNDNELLVIRTEDEDAQTTLEFKDKQGRLILQRKLIDNGNSKTCIDTYYVYYGIDRLYAVLPPMLSKHISVGNTVDKTLLNNYAYQYVYDDFGRIISKKIPGMAWKRMTYTDNDQLLTEQDGNQRAKGEYTFHLYDIFDNQCVTGVCKESVNKLLESTYCEYTGEKNALFGYEIPKTTLGDDVCTLNVNYYDTYNFVNDLDINLPNSYSKQNVYSQSKLTGTATKRLGEDVNDYDYSIINYDSRGRKFHLEKTNIIGGYDSYNYYYNIANQQTSKSHYHVGNRKEKGLSERYSYEYDHAGRLQTVNYSQYLFPNMKLVQKQYDKVGRLQKEIYNENNKLTTEYTYNIRSWLTSIKSPLQSEKIQYESPYIGGVPSYSGNISAIQWNTDSIFRIYRYVYDDLSRLHAADYEEPNNDARHDKYSVAYSYDRNGNIKSLKRKGNSGIEDLSFIYSGNQIQTCTEKTNNIINIKGDFAIGGNQPSSKMYKYKYDDNGNMIYNAYKNIDTISYNILNLPKKISFSNSKNSVNYLYNANGEKLMSTFSVMPIITAPIVSVMDLNTNLQPIRDWLIYDTVAYCDNVIYTNGRLTRILNDVGYQSCDSAGRYEYHYYLKDHEGNIRVVTDDEGNREQVNHYYPYGALFTEGVNANFQPYKYNGKELERMHGIDWYDYGARHYDASIGRWMTIDPLCEKYYSISPYAYCKNNPIKFIDLDGRDIVIWYKNFYGKDAYFIFNGFHGKKLVVPKNQYVMDVIQAYLFNVRNGGGDNLKRVVADNNLRVAIQEPFEDKRTRYQGGTNPVIFWNSHEGLLLTDGNRQSPATGLEHEMDHFVDEQINSKRHRENREQLDNQYDNKEERRVITGSETKTAISNKEGVRINHKGYLYETKSPITTEPK